MAEVESSAYYSNGGAATSSLRDFWETPSGLFEELDSEFGFTLDPCCNESNAKCAHHFTAEEDGLSESWSGERVFMNPPYGRQMPPWVEKAYAETSDGSCALVVGLMPARTDTGWFHDYIYIWQGGG